LGAVCEINPPKPKSLDSEALCSFVPMENVDDQSGTVMRLDVRRVSEVEKGYSHFQEGDVLFAKITPCMENGKCAIARHLLGGLGFGSTEFHVVRPKQDVVSQWIYYYLRQTAIRELAEQSMTGSAGQKRVPTRFLEDTCIPLPPLPEQQRIAGILARADRLRRLRRYALELSGGYLQAVFLEMFGDPVTNPKGWERANVSGLGHVQTGNTPSRSHPEYYGDHIEWIKSDDILEDSLFPSSSRERLSETGLKRGRSVGSRSILVTCIAGSLTSVGDVALTDRQLAFNQQLNAITPYGDVDPFFLYGLFRVARSLVQRNATAGMKHIITKSKLERVVLFKPRLPLQQEFAPIVRKYERLRAQQQEAERQAEHLFQTLLHRAFSGEL